MCRQLAILPFPEPVRSSDGVSNFGHCLSSQVFLPQESGPVAFTADIEIRERTSFGFLAELF
jgi:hypothetical protein